MTDENGHGQGLKSLDTALGVLAYMGTQVTPQSLTEIARACDMPPSKVHRYLASFVNAGLIKQQGRSGAYDLGPAALDLGLAAMIRHDFVNDAADGLADLSRETKMTVLLSVWANLGATVVRWERGATPTDTSIGLGTTLPLLNSATGRVFLAWGAPQAVSPVRDAQLRRLARNQSAALDFEPTQAGVAQLVEKTRERGFASVEGRFIPGLVAAAAPVLDWQGEVQAAITIVGIDPAAIAKQSPESEKLVGYCQTKSATGP